MLAAQNSKQSDESVDRHSRPRHSDRTATVIYNESFKFIQEIQFNLRGQGCPIDHGILASAALDLASELPDASDRIVKRALAMMQKRLIPAA